jgi:putative MFS transporter
VTKSLGYAFIIAIAYPVGPLLCAAFADRFERKHQIVAAAMITAVLGVIFARQSAPWALIALGVGVTFSNNLMSFAYHAYQTELYPTRIRARAVGFVYAWSRISTVFSSFIIAALLGAFGTTGVFAFIALAMAIVVLAVGVFGPRTTGASLDAISQ